MTHLLRIVALIFSSLAVRSACGTTALQRNTDSNPDQQVDGGGTSYIVEQLQNDPHFAGASVQLLHSDGEDINPEINVFSDDLKRQLFNSVLRIKGVSLALRPAVRQCWVQKTLASVGCGTMRHPKSFMFQSLTGNHSIR